MADRLGAVVVLTLQPNELPDQVKGGQHVTLLYFGDTPLREELYAQLLDAVSTAAEQYTGDGEIKTKKLERFGEDGDAVVVTLDSTRESLPVQFRNVLLNNLTPELYEVFKDAETYPDYKPHVTLGYISEGFPEDFELDDLPTSLDIADISVWNGETKTSFSLHENIEHYGIIRRSGRYPWGSGANPFQRSRSFMGYFEELKAQGLSETEIAKALGLNTRELRQHRAMAKAQIKKAQIAEAKKLKAKGWSNVEIGKAMDLNESTVRTLLDPEVQKRRSQVENTVEMLKAEMEKGNYVDFGRGSEFHMPGVTRNTLDNAITWLQDEGYQVHKIRTPLIGTQGKDTEIKVLTPPDVDWKTAINNQDKIKVPGASTRDGGTTWNQPRPPQNVDSSRIAVRYGPDGGAEKDGIIELRPGVSDLDLGKSRYAQVRIAVDGTHYLKGVAHYSDNLPDGVDIIFNTNKNFTPDPHDAMKPMSDDPINPWGAVVKEGGQRGALNILNEEGDWEQWSKTLSSQMLSKQAPSLAKEQLDLTYQIKKAELDEINALNNPTIKRHLLEKFADGADSSAIHLKAKELPRTQNHVLIPVTDMKQTEVYAPGYRDGERVVLIRHPHGGIFEIPELTVNNRNKTAQKIMGTNPRDAIGIHPQVAEQLSGADFDGDTVLVIPNPRGSKGGVKTLPPLKALEGFDPRIAYGADEVKTVNGEKVHYRQGVPFKTMTNTQTEMGVISNLITDMSIQDATQSELARAVKHSMVVIDAEKHGLDYKQSYVDNNILQLKKKYQLNPETNRAGGASTLISRAKKEIRIPEIKPRPASEGGPIDRSTGEKVYVPTGRTRRTLDRRTGKVVEVPQRTKVTLMENTRDAHTLSSGTRIESVYADHANKLKALANTARKEALGTPNLKYSPAAFKAYAPQVQSLNAQLNLAKSNAPLERKAHVLANQAVRQKKMANPHLDKDDIKKEERKALALYRARTGASKQRVVISPKEWEAIQAGAISDSKLRQILAHTDLDEVKALATPRTSIGMPPGKLSRARAMLSSGYTQAEVADALGVSTSTLSKAINE